jgi:mannose-6-phosphate isomerase
MIWYPFQLSTPIRNYVFGGHMMCEALGKESLPEDGARLTEAEWRKNLDSLLNQIHWSSHAEARRGQTTSDNAVTRRLCCTGPYFTLERVNIKRRARLGLNGCVILSNLGAPFTCEAQSITESINRTQTVLIPAACSTVDIPESTEFLLTYLPETTVTID